MTLSYIRKVIYVIRNIKISKMLLTLQWEGYLEETGWIDSYKQQKPVDANNNPLPWVTYSFIDFITGRLDKTMSVIEFGSGNSTLFFGKLVKKVHTVEHDQAWYKQIAAIVPGNVVIEFVELEENGAYARFAMTIKEPTDIIIVDGRDRANCMKHSVGSLSARGVLVLDDSERAEYADGIGFVLAAGFKRIDFWGIAPGIFYKKCTSIFYRSNNCLGI